MEYSHARQILRQKEFWYSLPTKKIVFHTELCVFLEERILKIGLFHRVKELFKSNQTRYEVLHLYLEYKTKRIFAIACLGKMLVFHTEVCVFLE